MRKILLALLLVFVLLPSVMAINLNVEKVSKNEVFLKGIDNSVTFNLDITNMEGADSFRFYNLLGFDMTPKEEFSIGTNETKTIKLTVKPISELKEHGFYTFTYFIKDSEGEDQEERLTFDIINLEDAFSIGSGEVDINSSTLQIYIKNNKNINFPNLNIVFDSVFFQTDKTMSLGPNEKKIFDVKLNKEDFKKLRAGFYTLNADINYKDQSANVEGTIEFKEKNLVTTTKKDYGFLINTQIIEKNNEGNTVEDSETIIRKNIISRIFTSFTPEPDVVDRQGTIVYYTWIREINPGESLKINVKTNWLFPFLLILFIVAIIILVKKYNKTSLVLRKRVSHVSAKGGEFALKVTIMIKAKNYVERVNIIDRLPPLVNVYEKFGNEKPTRVDEKSKKIEWNFEKLEAGEIRVLSYIIYSKVGVMGKFALPRTTAIFERDGEISEAESNKAYFVTEPLDRDKPMKEDLE